MHIATGEVQLPLYVIGNISFLLINAACATVSYFVRLRSEYRSTVFIKKNLRQKINYSKQET